MTRPPDLPVPQPSPLPVEELERRLKWRFAPLLVFAGLMIALGVVAAISLLAPVRTLTGLPDDPDTRAAIELVRARFPLGSGELRFRSALTGESHPGWPYSVEVAEAGDRASRLLARARTRDPLDPRLIASIAHLDLGRRRLDHAERGYRAAIELGPHYGEARLGLGVTLALEAEAEADPVIQRRLRLEAVAQLIAVPARDPEYDPALYDRALLLDMLGRRDDALRAGREFAGRNRASAWAETLEARLGMPRP
jgi:tetratricopeptide (TPR) repeat protein